MNNIIIASEKLKLYEYIGSICEYFGYSNEYKDKFWQDLLNNTEIYNEFLYYADKKVLKCEYEIDGMNISDILVWEMRKYNITHDLGKNGPECDKIKIVFDSFRTFMDMLDNSEKIKKDIETKNGMDNE